MSYCTLPSTFDRPSPPSPATQQASRAHDKRHLHNTCIVSQLSRNKYSLNQCILSLTCQWFEPTSARSGNNQSVRSSAPVVSRCSPSGYNVKLYISRGRLAWWLLAFLCCDFAVTKLPLAAMFDVH